MVKKNPLVSITIPTYNSEETFETTLQSVIDQDYGNYEIIVIDKESNDRTLEIARKFNCKIFNDTGKLLGSRYIGVRESKGEFVVLLDSDQVLDKTSISRTVKLMNEQDWDMVFLEEDSYLPLNTIEKLTSLDRRAYHKKRVIDPSKSVLLPRVFRKAVISKAFEKIPHDLFEFVILQDHAIIYHECYKISKRVGYVPKAVYHREPKTIRELFEHYYAWGTRSLEGFERLPREYQEMFLRKLNSRSKSVDFGLDFILSLPILAIKGTGYYFGNYSAKLKALNG